MNKVIETVSAVNNPDILQEAPCRRKSLVDLLDCSMAHS